MLKIAWCSNYYHQLPENHRFPMEKYNLLPEQLLYEGTIERRNVFTPDRLEPGHILNTHCKDYWHRLKHLRLSTGEIRRTGFPLTRELVIRETTIAQGTLEAAVFALQYGVAFNMAGGTHHAGWNYGEGFCLLNDIAISANYLLQMKMVPKILIIDLDVHQGNGTAEIFHEQEQVVTFSMHGANNFPLKKARSDLDVALRDGTGDDDYLKTLEHYLNNFCDEAGPGFVYYQAGVDVLHTDALGRLNLSINGCQERDRMVFEFCKQRKIPVAVVMGGGYSPKISNIVEAHANTFRVAADLFT